MRTSALPPHERPSSRPTGLLALCPLPPLSLLGNHAAAPSPHRRLARLLCIIHHGPGRPGCRMGKNQNKDTHTCRKFCCFFYLSFFLPICEGERVPTGFVMQCDSPPSLNMGNLHDRRPAKAVSEPVSESSWLCLCLCWLKGDYDSAVARLILAGTSPTHIPIFTRSPIPARHIDHQQGGVQGGDISKDCLLA